VLEECDQPAVGAGDTMGVCAEITQYVFRAAEGLLGVDAQSWRNSTCNQAAKALGCARGRRLSWNWSSP